MTMDDEQVMAMSKRWVAMELKPWARPALPVPYNLVPGWADVPRVEPADRCALWGHELLPAAVIGGYGEAWHGRSCRRCPFVLRSGPKAST